MYTELQVTDVYMFMHGSYVESCMHVTYTQTINIIRTHNCSIAHHYGHFIMVNIPFIHTVNYS